MSRTIVVGDVHGCARELGELLDRIGPTADDRVYLTGDLMVRGPQPRRVLELVRECGALAVRGNHEHRLLRWRRQRAAAGERSLRRGGDSGKTKLLRNPMLTDTATQLSDEDWALIEELPLWRDVPGRELRVLHAGVIPGKRIEDHDERTLMYLRCITAEGQPSELRDDGELWAKRYQGPPHVVFGHHARFEPQLQRWATGIDTACVYGGRLTALVVDDDDPIPAPEARGLALVSVAAHEVYFPVR